MDSEKEKGLARQLTELSNDLLKRDLDELAIASQSDLVPVEGNGKQNLMLTFWGNSTIVDTTTFVGYDSKTGAALNLLDQALLSYYLWGAKDVPLAEKWISFSELSDGRFYDSAFQGYTGKLLQVFFGDNYDLFTDTAIAAGGKQNDFATIAFGFLVLPRVPVLLACWMGDEDFLSSYKILFDASIESHFATDSIAILGSRLTSIIINKAKESTHENRG